MKYPGYLYDKNDKHISRLFHGKKPGRIWLNTQLDAIHKIALIYTIIQLQQQFISAINHKLELICH